ncbi:hypothetical protein DVS77_18900 [Mycolicibacterium moriokaense]|nr:hypothetical protein DVS77_18900 [Mycolicibacterium moriokaense]
MGARRRSGGDSSFAVIFVAVLVIGAIIKFIWWIVGAAALVGAFFAVRAIVRAVEQRRLEAAAREAELARRADLQHRWTLRGDSRGVYGAEGAKAMRAVFPTPESGAASEWPEDLPAVAAVAYTKGELASLLKERQPCWRWAAFASVLVQRRAAVADRLRDSALGFVGAQTTRLTSGPEVRYFVSQRIEEVAALVGQVESFMLTPAFVEVFGDPGDEATADGDGIVHTANRLMDYHERFLTISEQCRDVSAPSEYSDLMGDLTKFADIPLQGYRTFIDDFVERVGEMPELLRYASGPVEVDPVLLHMDGDEQLLDRMFKRLRAIRGT